jgi:CBS domain-containing protein
MKKVADFMVPYPKYCAPHESLPHVARQMWNCNVGSLPVVDDFKRVVGIITDRDVCLAVGRETRPLAEIMVHELMSAPVYTCKSDDDASYALKLMRTRQVGRLPVVDEEKRLKGIVSLNNIARAVYGTDDAPEVLYIGEENILTTLQTIAERNHSMESV